MLPVSTSANVATPGAGLKEFNAERYGSLSVTNAQANEVIAQSIFRHGVIMALSKVGPRRLCYRVTLISDFSVICR